MDKQLMTPSGEKVYPQTKSTLVYDNNLGKTQAQINQEFINSSKAIREGIENHLVQYDNNNGLIPSNVLVEENNVKGIHNIEITNQLISPTFNTSVDGEVIDSSYGLRSTLDSNPTLSFNVSELRGVSIRSLAYGNGFYVLCDTFGKIY